MGSTLPPDELELYRRCDEVLHYLWDPIGVADVPEARDEYRSYLPQAFQLAKEGDRAALTAFMMEVARNNMGLEPNEEVAGRAAEIMIAYRDRILHRSAS